MHFNIVSGGQTNVLNVRTMEHLLLALIVLLMFFDAFAHHKWSKIPFTRLSYVNTI